MQRRAFLQTALQAAASAAFAIPQRHAAAEETGAVPIRLGFDTYSLRAFRWKAMQLLDYAAAQKLDTIQISSSGDYESLDAAHLARVKEHAASLGIALDAGIGCICPTSTSWNVKNGDPVENLALGLRVAKAIQVLRVSRAGDRGMRIGLENHAGEMQAREVRTIIEETGKDFVGACLDTGNPMWVVEERRTSARQWCTKIHGPPRRMGGARRWDHRLQGVRGTLSRVV